MYLDWSRNIADGSIIFQFTDDENQDLSGESENGYVQNSKKVWKNLQEDSC